MGALLLEMLRPMPVSVDTRHGTTLTVQASRPSTFHQDALVGTGKRIVGVPCPDCSSDYESAILWFNRDNEGLLVGMQLRCKACFYSWRADRWGNPT